MKLTKHRLKEIIKEELNEAVSPSAVIMKHKKDPNPNNKKFAKSKNCLIIFLNFI